MSVQFDTLGIDRNVRPRREYDRIRRLARQEVPLGAIQPRPIDAKIARLNPIHRPERMHHPISQQPAASARAKPPGVFLEEVLHRIVPGNDRGSPPSHSHRSHRLAALEPVEHSHPFRGLFHPAFHTRPGVRLVVDHPRRQRDRPPRHKLPDETHTPTLPFADIKPQVHLREVHMPRQAHPQHPRIQKVERNQTDKALPLPLIQRQPRRKKRLQHPARHRIGDDAQVRPAGGKKGSRSRHARDRTLTAVTPIPHCQPGLWPAEIPAARFASLIKRDSPKGCQIGLIGLADDLGVRLNNGRPGAKDGPRTFRAALAKYGVADPHNWTWPAVHDAGDIIPAAGSDEKALHETHRRVTEAVSAMLDAGLFPIGIGGGHDLTFPFVRAVTKKHPGLNGVYFDAHLDVRPTVGSGMPFRRLIEDCGVKHLELIGFNEFANSREHFDWFASHGGKIGTPLSDSPRSGEFFVSLDLDVFDVTHAPGVSAANPAGLRPRQLGVTLSALARSAGVRCFDIMELNPAYDIDGHTARLAAHMFLVFLRDFAMARASTT